MVIIIVITIVHTKKQTNSVGGGNPLTKKEVYSCKLFSIAQELFRL